MNNFIKKSLNMVTSQIKMQNKNFFPCPRIPCYCEIVVNYPEHTTITKELIENANKCRREYYTIQNYVDKENPRD